MADPAAAPVEEATDYGEPPGGIVKRWLAASSLVEKQDTKWHRRGVRIVRRYRDERGDGPGENTRRFNVLWSNVQTLGPALYARTPRPQVDRRYKMADPVGRLASQIWERAVTTDMEADDFDGLMRADIEDYLLPGRGLSRVYYEPTFGPDGETIVSERARLRHIFWQDFAMGPARSWDEVPWIRFREYMTRDQLKKRFPKVAAEVPLTRSTKGFDDSKFGEQSESFKQAVVWEIWERATKRVWWICPDYTEAPLDMRPDPLKLTGFWPCPKPIAANLTTDTTVPVPDYAQYQDQASEIDTLTARIAKLIPALKFVGAYAASEKTQLGRILQEGVELDMLPVDNWQALADKGGIDKFLWFMPVEQIANVVLSLVKARESFKQDLFEVSGLSDILRGQGAASETATAQRIKGRFATLRLEDRQRTVNCYARDLLRLKAEVIAETFTPKTLSAMSGLPELPPEPPKLGPNAAQDPQQAQEYQAAYTKWQDEVFQAQAQFDAAIQLLRSDKLRGFRLDIETDATIAPDEQADKQASTELITALGQFFTGVAPLVAQGIVPLEVAKQVLLFMVRRFRVGRELESALEAVEDMPPPQPAGDPGAAQAAATAQIESQKLQLQSQTDQGKLALEQQKLEAQRQKDQAELGLKNAELTGRGKVEEAKIMLEVEKLKLEAAKLGAEFDRSSVDRQKAEFDATMRVAEHHAGQQELRNQRNDKQAEAMGLPAGEKAASYIDQSTETLQSLMQSIAAITDAMNRQHEMATAPRELVRNPDGSAVVRIGQREHPVMTDAGGNVTGLGPAS